MKNYAVLIMILFWIAGVCAQPIAQWRGPNRNGVFPGTGLLKSWPAQGPELLWSNEDLDEGFSTPSISGDVIYVTGKQDSTEYLSALDMNGNRLWRLAYGRTVRQSYPETRCTPTVQGDRVYMISGRGEVVCINGREKKIAWKVDAFEKFRGAYWQWEIAESPLLVDDKVIYTPGGQQTTMVALDKMTGETIWQTECINDTCSFVSPILVEYGGKKIIVNLTIKYLIGVNADNGQIIWKVNYHDIETPTWHAWAPKNNCVTPIYDDGHLFITSGYDHVAVMFKIVKGGKELAQVWTNPVMDTHHGQVVHVGNYLYGSNWIDNNRGNWCCLDWATGKTKYETEWQTKGPISAADGMLYCIDERRGNLALVEPNPQEFKIISSFRVRPGRGPYWAQPVIHNGVLYVRHGKALLAFNIKA